MGTTRKQREAQQWLTPRSACAALIVLLAMAGCGSSEKAMTIPASDLAFTGTIVVVHSSTVDGLDPEHSVIVDVGDVYRSPDGLESLKGEMVTVRLKDVAGALVGQKRTFFADVVSIGTDVGVSEVQSEPAVEKGAEFAQKVQESDRKRADDDLRRRTEQARVVALGKIVSITPLQKEQDLDREHDPDWQVVEFRPSTIAKGVAQETIRFLYPGSRDILFAGFPILKADEQWTVILDTISQKEVGLVIAQPSNLMPPSEFRHVESVMKK
jgi:hypothetical protein